MRWRIGQFPGDGRPGGSRGPQNQNFGAHRRGNGAYQPTERDHGWIGTAEAPFAGGQPGLGNVRVGVLEGVRDVAEKDVMSYDCYVLRSYDVTITIHYDIRGGECGITEELSKGANIVSKRPISSLQIDSIFKYSDAIEDLNLGRN
jgi:hypothetical protein